MTAASKTDFPFSEPERFLPHRGAVRLVEEILRVTEDELLCRARVRRGSPFGGEKGAPTVVGLEMAAQASAIHQGLATGFTSVTGVGYLVRVRRVSLSVATLPLEKAIQVAVRLQGAAPPLFRYEVEVVLGSVPLLSGDISIYATGATRLPGTNGGKVSG